MNDVEFEQEQKMIEVTRRLILAIALANMKDKSGINPVDFYGMEDVVIMSKTNPVEAIRLAILEAAMIRWNGKDPLWGSSVEEIRKSCRHKLTYDLAFWDECQLSDSLKVINYDQRCPNVLSAGIVENHKNRFEKLTNGIVIEESESKPIESTNHVQ